jgi:hypothetical protein
MLRTHELGKNPVPNPFSMFFKNRSAKIRAFWRMTRKWMLEVGY